MQEQDGDRVVMEICRELGLGVSLKSTATASADTSISTNTMSARR